MLTLQTGTGQTQNFYEALLAQLQRAGELSGLDTVEMEELTQWASMVTENHSQNISRARQMLMSGLPKFERITNEQRLQDAVIEAVLQATAKVRMAAVIRRPNKPPKVVIYLGR